MPRVIAGNGDEIEPERLRELADGLVGRLLLPGDDGYDTSRRVWNAAVDRRPALIARCEGVADVVDALRFAREYALPLCVRGGGHNVAGTAVRDGALMIDLSAMNAVHVDPRARTARAEAGCTWGDLDRATLEHGMVTPGGVVSTTGIAGLTLGGGVGWLVRRRGMSIDNLRGVELVTVEGDRVTANDAENPELFWGLRGGGGNFGIATAFEYELHEQGPVLGGMLVHPRSAARELLRFHRDFIEDAPWELTAHASLGVSPDGDPVASVVGCYSGDPDEAEGVLQPLREHGAPLHDAFVVRPYADMQALVAPMFPPGRHHVWRSGFFAKVPDDAVLDAVVEAAADLPSALCGVAIEYYGGRAALPDPDATAFPHRGKRANLIVRAQWHDPGEGERLTAWADGVWRALEPFTEGAYYNYLHDAGPGRVHSALAGNHDRLVALKERWDPGNVLDWNHNIRP